MNTYTQTITALLSADGTVAQNTTGSSMHNGSATQLPTYSNGTGNKFSP